MTGPKLNKSFEDNNLTEEGESGFEWGWGMIFCPNIVFGVKSF